tara:strand:+ start:102 stop:662 length:561 start_codon:yes stop_codon:yes gene_type:complete
MAKKPKSPFAGEEYYFGTEDDDIAWIDRFIVKHNRKEGRRVPDYEVLRIQNIQQRLIDLDSFVQSDRDQKLDEAISRVNDEYLQRKADSKVEKIIETKVVTDTKIVERVEKKIVERFDPAVPATMMMIAIPMMLIYANDWSFWGSGICLGIGWILFILVGIGGMGEQPIPQDSQNEIENSESNINP